MKYLLITLFILGAFFVISQAIISNSTSNTETVHYEVIAEFDGFEIRNYPELIVASTNLEASSYGEISRTGFRRIASYIFGGNTENRQIAMTSPVQMDMKEHSKMSFYMPSYMDSSDLPSPNRNDVTIETENAKTVAAIRFSGWASDALLVKNYNQLKSMLLSEGISFKEGFSYLGYNPPYQMVNRRNEVIIELSEYTIDRNQ